RPHAVVGGEAADEDAADAGGAEEAGEAGALEAGVRLLVRRRRLADDHGVVGEREVRVEVGALGALDAVGRPRPALRLERDVVRRVPVARGEDGDAGRLGGLDPAVEDGDDGVAPGHGERAAGAEVALDVDEEEGVALAEAGRGHGGGWRWAWEGTRAPGTRSPIRGAGTSGEGRSTRDELRKGALSSLVPRPSSFPCPTSSTPPPSPAATPRPRWPTACAPAPSTSSWASPTSSGRASCSAAPSR